MGQTKFKRRQYIVDRNFQYGFIRKVGLLSLFILLASLGSFVIIYHVSEIFQDEAIAQPDPFSLYGVDVTIVESSKISHLLVKIWPFILACTLIAMIVTIFFGIMISHRMAGPVFRMRRILSKMADGDISGPVERLRQKDEFKPLFSDIQSVKKRLQESIGEIQQICNKLDDNNQKQLIDKFRKIIFSFNTDKV